MEITKCVNCQKSVKYRIVETKYEYEDDDVKLNYNGKMAICEECGKEIIIDEIEDYNQARFEEEYRKMNKIITEEEINQILEKYDIGKRPLSLLLGFGEITITRYLTGYVPTKKNSILLKKVLSEPETYYSILMANKKNITALAYSKSLKAVSKYIDDKSMEDNNIHEVADYIISQLDVTPKGLQKILYYIQLFSCEFLNCPAFSSSCKKWGHGPVFGKIYYQYKEYGYKVITRNESRDFKIDNDLLEISNAVIKYFGCYSADVLEEFTHKEKPWIETNDSEIIEKEIIKEFAHEICNEHGINSISDIGKYSKYMFNNFLESR